MSVRRLEARRDERPEPRPVEARLDHGRERPAAEARHEERLERPPVEAMRRDPQVRDERRQAPAGVVDRADEGLLSGARRLTNRAFDALDEMGNWVTGRK